MLTPFTTAEPIGNGNSGVQMGGGGLTDPAASAPASREIHQGVAAPPLSPALQGTGHPSATHRASSGFKKGKLGQAFSPAAKTPSIRPRPTSERWVQFPAQLPVPALCKFTPWEAVGGGPSTWVPATPAGDPDGVPGSQLQLWTLQLFGE